MLLSEAQVQEMEARHRTPNITPGCQCCRDVPTLCADWRAARRVVEVARTVVTFYDRWPTYDAGGLHPGKRLFKALDALHEEGKEGT